jgi:hypothetical protein
MASEAPSADHGPDPQEAAATINRRIAQLDWPVVAEVETDASGGEIVSLHRVAPDGFSRTSTPPLRIGSASLGRPNLVESILEELRARGWNRSGRRSAPRADVLWCAPA